MTTLVSTRPLPDSRHRLARWLLPPLALALGLACQTRLAAQELEPEPGRDYSANELPEPQPAARYLIGNGRPTWPAAVVRYYYNPSQQPAGLSTETALAAFRTAAGKWENLCNVRFEYQGTTSAQPDVNGSSSSIDRINVIGWRALTGDKSRFGAYVQWWRTGSQMTDADMVINTNYGSQLARNPKDLETLVTHEMGHMLAIDHSDRQQSVMFANPYNSYAFQATLRGDDAAACASLYGAAPQATANRVFNWAEQTYPQQLWPSGNLSQDWSDYHYRFYAGSNSFVAVRNGRLLYLELGGQIVDLGPVSDFLHLAAAAGF